MQLERVEISGFRGIRRLSLDIDELTVLIGENMWGKSSLLDALSIALSPEHLDYKFRYQDFHRDHQMGHEKSCALQIVLQFKANHPKQPYHKRYRALEPLWCWQDKQHPRIYYRLVAHNIGKVKSYRDFINASGQAIEIENINRCVRVLCHLHPIIRLRDARHLRDDRLELANTSSAQVEKRIHSAAKRLRTMPGDMSDAEITSGLSNMRKLVEHYFAFKPHARIPQPGETPASAALSSPQQSSLQGMATLSQLLGKNSHKQSRLILLALLSEFLQAKGDIPFGKSIRPILVFEDPEGRLHPTALNQVWGLMQQLPMQKIVTTNSGELLSSCDISAMRRLVRQSGQTHSFQVKARKMSVDEMRRVGFHVRFHRPTAFFARVWLLVEGETEVWLFNEFARLFGYSFAAEGIQIIEFAQCGLKPLIKIAKQLGIEWHVITDGDMAGEKYAATVANYAKETSLTYRLTKLKQRDIEHFLYEEGFEPLFREMAGITPNTQMPAKKVITKVLRKYAKPDVAIAVVNYCEQHLQGQIPPRLKRVIARLVGMARSIL